VGLDEIEAARVLRWQTASRFTHREDCLRALGLIDSATGHAHAKHQGFPTAGGGAE